MFELKLSEFIIATKNTHINNRIEFRVEHTRAHFGPITNADVIAERICFFFIPIQMNTDTLAMFLFSQLLNDAHLT